MRIRSVGTAVMAITAATLMAAAGLWAIEVRRTGVIQAKGADSIQVQGETFVVNGQTQIMDRDKAPLSFGALEVGNLVEAEGMRQSGGTVLAGKIKIEDAAENEVELTGTIEALGADSLQVGGSTFGVTSQTQVLDHQNNPISFADLQLGQLVEVKADGNSMVAERVRVEDEHGGRGDEVEFESEVESVGDDSLHMMRKTVWVDDRTILEGQRHRSIQLSDIRRGVTARVEGSLQGDGTVLARKVTADVSPSGRSQIATGTITAKGRSFIKLGARKFTVNAATRIEDAGSEHIPFASLRVGQRVRVEYRKSGAALVAKEITVL